MENQEIQFTFIIPLFNSESTVEDTLESIIQQDINQSYQIIVVDDESTDRSVQIIEHWKQKHGFGDSYLEIVQQKHAEEAAAINAGLKKAQGKFVIWLESDVILGPNWLSYLIKEFDDNHCGGAGGLLLPAKADPWLAKVLGYEIAFKMRCDGAEVKHITSANAIYRREIFSELGECKLHLGASSFDSEYNHRIREKGWILRRNTNALAWHHYKTRIWDCLVRTFWYGFRRPFVKTQVLYEADRWVGALVLLSMAAPLALIYCAIDFYWGLVLFLVVLFAHLIYGWIIYSYFHYLPLLCSGPVFMIRNITFFLAYCLGLIVFTLSKQK